MNKTTSGKWGSVTFNFDWQTHVNEKIDPNQMQREMQYVIDQKILRLIDSGLSPVNGERAFAKYKHPKQYPGSKKPSNKANLTLTGETLSYYEARKTDEPTSVTMGIHKDAPEFVRLKANVNNFGNSGGEGLSARSRKATASARKGIPARPFVPDGKKGQSFTREIVLAIRQAFANVMIVALRKVNSK